MGCDQRFVTGEVLKGAPSRYVFGCLDQNVTKKEPGASLRILRPGRRVHGLTGTVHHDGGLAG
jgi:hypothetical protein